MTAEAGTDQARAEAADENMIDPAVHDVANRLGLAFAIMGPMPGNVGIYALAEALTRAIVVNTTSDEGARRVAGHLGGMLLSRVEHWCAQGIREHAREQARQHQPTVGDVGHG